MNISALTFFFHRRACPAELRMISGALFGLVAFCFFSVAGTAQAASPVDSTKYIVGPGDVFTVEFFESQIKPLEVEVSLEGLAQAPSVGSFPVSGLTLMEAKRVLAEGFRKKYSGEEPTITLKAVRKLRTLVSGAVKKPGLYELPATALVSDIISRAGGLLPGASRRNIVIRSDTQERFVDLEMFTRGGITDANPPLYLGDVVFVPQAEDSSARVHVSGEVRSPGSFEYTGRDRISDLIRLGGGVTSRARADSALLTGEGEERVSINSPKVLGPGDGVLVFASERRRAPENVYVGGKVFAPGRYAMSEGMTLGAAIDRAGGATDEAYLAGVVVFNNTLAPDEFSVSRSSDAGAPGDIARVTPPAQNVRAEAFERESERNTFVLMPGDSIVVPVKKGVVAALGEVKSPGLVHYEVGGTAGRISLGELLSEAGGVTSWADLSESYLSRRFSGAQIPLSANPAVFDGDVVYIARRDKRSGGGALATIRDIALIGAGVVLTALAIDELGD